MADLTAALQFLQRLIQTPSLPGQEEAMAALVLAEMRTLGYDEAWMDEAGNVIGLIRGRGEVPALMFNTHLDHVDPGDPATWPAYGQPYSGAVHEGKVWGRGASDIKGPLAAQVHGVARLLQAGERPPGDVYVSAVVQEEVGGLGARLLAQTLKDTVAYVVIGEPSSNELRRGHRGRTELVVHVVGRAVHASAPERGVNPLFVLANFLQRLPSLEMALHDELGYSSVAPTLIRTDQSSANVIPGEAWLTLDWRNIPGESNEDAQNKVHPLLTDSLIEGAIGEILLAATDRVSFTGYERAMQSDNPAYSLGADHPAVRAAEQVLAEGLGREIPTKLWRFATDGGHFARVGMTVIGFGPGDERVVHTVNEHIDLDEWTEALHANAILAQRWLAFK
ncbi:MAG: M20/M25/M40 family metallo-hydrolase [Ardenticatenales bacterium]|nr:M20/M25/M40 family metallo-hydrolase [Ardenticatenales bacterium]